jgi:hypothetical protein
MILTVLTSGCDDRATRIAREAADRQAQQNNAMGELNKQIAIGTRFLVETDGQARQEHLALHRDIEAERHQLDDAWNRLEVERKAVAQERRGDSLLVIFLERAGSTVLIVVLLGFCWYVLVRDHSTDTSDRELSQLLLHELASPVFHSLINPVPYRARLGHDPPSQDR